MGDDAHGHGRDQVLGRRTLGEGLQGDGRAAPRPRQALRHEGPTETGRGVSRQMEDDMDSSERLSGETESAESADRRVAAAGTETAAETRGARFARKAHRTRLYLNAGAAVALLVFLIALASIFHERSRNLLRGPDPTPSTIAHPRERPRGCSGGAAAPGEVCGSAPRPFQGTPKPSFSRAGSVAAADQTSA